MSRRIGRFYVSPLSVHVIGEYGFADIERGAASDGHTVYFVRTRRQMVVIEERGPGVRRLFVRRTYDAALALARRELARIDEREAARARAA